MMLDNIQVNIQAYCNTTPSESLKVLSDLYSWRKSGRDHWTVNAVMRYYIYI